MDRIEKQDRKNTGLFLLETSLTPFVFKPYVLGTTALYLIGLEILKDEKDEEKAYLPDLYQTDKNKFRSFLDNRKSWDIFAEICNEFEETVWIKKNEEDDTLNAHLSIKKGKRTWRRVDTGDETLDRYSRRENRMRMYGDILGTFVSGFGWYLSNKRKLILAPLFFVYSGWYNLAEFTRFGEVKDSYK